MPEVQISTNSSTEETSPHEDLDEAEAENMEAVETELDETIERKPVKKRKLPIALDGKKYYLVYIFL